MHSNQGVEAQLRSGMQRANARIGAWMGGRTPIFSLASLVSALVGLGIGLFVAWQVWPVAWTGAWRADLDPDAKAQYLAAVADAYVASGEDVNALMLAQRRVQGMDLATDIPNVVAYFQQGALSNVLAQTDEASTPVRWC